MSADNTKLRAQQDRGAEAKRIIDSPLVTEFFTKMKDAVRREWENSDAADKDEREHQWRLFQAIGLLEDCFKQTISTGDGALKELIRRRDQQAKQKG
jgi:hypothetical protein